MRSLSSRILFFVLVLFSVSSFAGDLCICPCPTSINLLEPIVKTAKDISAGVHGIFLNSSLFRSFEGKPDKDEKTVTVPVVFKTGDLTDKQIKEILNPHYEASNDAGLLLMFRAPSAFSLRDCGENAVTVSESDANTMINPNVISNNKAGSGSRFSDVDAEGRTREFKVESGNCTRSLSVGVRAYQLINAGNGAGGDLIAQAAGTKLVEAFHRSIGYSDPYNRKYYGYDHFGDVLTDPNGKTFDAKDGQLFILPIRIKYDEYKKLFGSENSKITLDSGAQAELPVSKSFGQASAGAFANVTATEKINDQWAATMGAGLGANIQTTLSGGYQPTDSKVTPSYNAHIAGAVTRADRSGDASSSFVLDVGSESPILKKSNYSNSLVDKDQDFTYAQGQRANVSQENAFTISFVRTNGNNSYTVGCAEDFKTKSWGMNGNNNQDFKCEAEVTHRTH